MKEKPILFSGPMVRAILEGRKLQTRRAIHRIASFGIVRQFDRSDTQGYDFHFRCKRGLWQDFRLKDLLKHCPYGEVGHRLWVRETCRAEELPSGVDGVRYHANDAFVEIENTVEAWWQNGIEPFRDRPGSVLRTEFLPGRLRFLKPGQEMVGPNERPPFGCVLCIWDRMCRPVKEPTLF